MGPFPTRIIDSHVHVFPDRLQQLAKKVMPSKAELLNSQVAFLRSQGRTLLKPVSKVLHQVQPLTRFLPRVARDALDSVGAMAMIPGIIVESNPADLEAALDDSQISHALVIAHPPGASSEFILELAQENERFVPVVYVPRNTPRPSVLLRKYVDRGAKALKLHPAADGESVDSFRYRRLLQTADDMGLPVIIHTGCLNVYPLYRDPGQGDAVKFRKWYGMYPNIKFVLAHMNFHSPGDAIDLAEEFTNIYLETSWQPSETVAEAVSRIGAKRIMFGSDWPLLGANIAVGIERIRECGQHGLMQEDQINQVLGLTASEVFGIPDTSNAT